MYKGDEVEVPKDQTRKLGALKEENQCLGEALLQEKNAHATLEFELQQAQERTIQVEGNEAKAVLDRLDEILLMKREEHFGSPMPRFVTCKKHSRHIDPIANDCSTQLRFKMDKADAELSG